MKKTFLILFFILLPHICFGENFHWTDENGNIAPDEEVANLIGNSFMDGLKEQAKENLPIYNKLKTCLPANGKYFQIIGKENNLCHFKVVDYDCLIPLNIAKEYAELGITSIQEILKGNFSTKSAEAVKMNEILSNADYCSYKMNFSVTMYDENGNEVPVKGIIIE